jgi:hypothetical protein
MKNNVWEEQTMDNNIASFHEEILSKTKLPKWMSKMICPFCQNELPLRSIRSISFCLNTRNYGDLSIELLCEKCSQMDTVYYREEIDDITKFIKLLTDSSPRTDPIIEEDMYKMQYNNIINKMSKLKEVDNINDSL